MIRRLLMLVVLSGYACALAGNVYYVSSSTGSDSYTATQAQNPATPWKTLAKVNAFSFAAGDRVLLARGDVWHEPLVPLSSGITNVPIAFDAYGSGAAPEISGYQALSGWTLVSGNVWSAPVAAPAMSWVLFGTLWGTKQTSQGALQHERDFFLNGNLLYVYSTAEPTSYYGTVAAMVLTNTPLISVNGKSWLTFQHMKIDWFDQYGVYVTGASDHLVFANMEVDGMIPAGALPLGFYVNTTPGAGDLQFLNCDAHMNYDGFRFDGTLTGTANVIVNAKAYFNRDYGINDTTGGHVTYSYSHLYGNGIGVLPSTDAVGAVEAGGTGNGHMVAKYTAPAVNQFARYPARISYSIDDEGKSLGGADYVDNLLPQFTSRNLKLSIAVVTGEQYASGDAARIRGWFNAGHDINSHSWSHNYYDTAVINMKYTGTGTAATLTIAGNHLTTSVTGGPGGENLDLDFATYATFGQLSAAISGHAGYTASINISGAGTSTKLANVSAVDIKSATYGLMVNGDAFVQDEMAKSKSWLLANVPGLPASELVYVYPSGKQNYQTQIDAVAAGYKGARGALSMGSAIAGTFTTNSGPAPMESLVKSVYGYGVNVQNITSLSAGGFSGMTAAQMAPQIASLVNKAKAWGVPYGLFTHPPETGAPELTVTEIGSVLDGLIAAGATVMTNTQIVDYLASQKAVTGSTLYVASGSSAGVNLTETAGSATVKSGSNLGAAYAVDLAGVKRPASGAWDIGAQQILWAKHGSGPGAGHFRIGGASSGVTGENAYCGAGDVAVFGGTDGPATLPQACVYTALAGTPSPGAVRTVAGDCSDLQAQIDAAVAGDTIVIPAAATCSGQYTFGPKSGADRNHWITVRSSATTDANFPAEGAQATPCQINITHVDGYPDYLCSTPGVRMPTIKSNVKDTSPVTVTGSFYRFTGLNITKTYGLGNMKPLVKLDGSDHVIFDRYLIHGDDWSLGSNFDAHLGISTRGTYQAFVNGWCYDVDYNSADGQCISGGTGSQKDEGPIKIYNSLLAGASEDVMFGGGAAVAWPHDLEIRRNLFLKPLKWMVAIEADIYDGPNQVAVNVKNQLEFKHGHRVLVEDNVFSNIWKGQSDQDGSAILLLPKNQSKSTTVKYVNTNGTAVSCAKDVSGTPCDAHTGAWGNQIVNVARSGNVVTINGSTDGGWPANYNPGGRIVIQGIPSQTVNGVNLNSLNGEWIMGCLNADTCTDGYDNPRVIYLTAADNPALAGVDFPQTSTTGLTHDFTAQSCAKPGHCFMSAPTVSYPINPIVSVQDSEHITVTQDLGVQTGVTHTSCHPGLAPDAQVQDFTFRYNYITHAKNVGLSITNAISNCGDMTKGVSQVSVHDVLADDIDPAAWDRQSSCCNSGGYGPSINNGYVAPSAWPRDIALSHLTFAGVRGWPKPAPASSYGFMVDDNFYITYTATTLQRLNNVVTITFGAKSGVPQYQQGNVYGFTGAYSGLNGVQTFLSTTSTSVTFANTGADINPAITVSAGTTGAAKIDLRPVSYYQNVTLRDSILGPINTALSTANGGVAAGFARNLCDPLSPTSCTWTMKNVVTPTALYSNYNQVSDTPYPTVNPDASSTCGISGGCSVADFSTVFVNWGTGMGETSANNYQVTGAYRGAASDGKDVGADIARVSAAKSAVLPHFTYSPLVIATSSLTPCTNNVYCEQQLTISSGASGALGFVRWRIVSGTLPAGMSLSTNDGANTCKVNGAIKHDPTGCAGWIWGTPTQSGSFPVTFEAEDAAHQKATVSVTLAVS